MGKTLSLGDLKLKAFNAVKFIPQMLYKGFLYLLPQHLILGTHRNKKPEQICFTRNL